MDIGTKEFERNHMDPITKEVYLKELENFALQMERCVNKLDCVGGICPICSASARDTHSEGCTVGKVCDRIREVREAHRALGLHRS